LVSLAAADKVLITLYVELRPDCDMGHYVVQVLSYDVLRRELDVDSVRGLEDLVIEAMYAVSIAVHDACLCSNTPFNALQISQGLLSGKFDPANGVLRVKSTMARDVKTADIQALIDTLTAWYVGRY
jgi:hypothetical protein